MAQDDARNFEPASLTNEELAYMAGFFDGEGSITIHHNYRPSPRGKSPNHTLQVSIGNTDPRVVTWIAANFGGSLVVRREVRENHRGVLQWIARSNDAANVLRALLPFLRMKKEQAQIAIAFQGEKAGYRKKRLSPEEIEGRERQMLSIRELNKVQHIAPRAAA